MTQTLSSLIAELSLYTTWHVTWHVARDKLSMCCMWFCPGNFSIRVGDSSRHSKEIVKNLKLPLWMWLLLILFLRRTPHNQDSTSPVYCQSLGHVSSQTSGNWRVKSCSTISWIHVYLYKINNSSSRANSYQLDQLVWIGEGWLRVD